MNEVHPDSIRNGTHRRRLREQCRYHPGLSIGDNARCYSTRPRVAVVYPTPFGDDGHVGGGERYAHELARALSRLVPTRLVLFGRERRRYLDGGLRVEVYPWLVLVRGQRCNPFGLRFLASLLDVDVIHCPVWHTLMTDMAVMLAHVMRKRVFVTDVGGSGNLSLGRWLDIGGRVDGFLALSEYSANISRYGDGGSTVYRGKTHVIYGGAAIPDASLSRLESPVLPTKLLFVGRLLPHKGVDVLIRAMPPSQALTVVGRVYDHQYYATLQQLAIGKIVTFVTDADDNRLTKELHSSTLLVHPAVYDAYDGSHTDVPELFGLAVVEAMMCGIPTIVSSAGSLPELVVDGVTGLVVPPGDVEALRQAIEQLVTDAEGARKMGLAGRARAIEQFSWDAVAERCLQCYRSV